MFKLEEDFLPCSLQTPLPVPGTVTGTRGVAHTVEKCEVRRFLLIGHHTWTELRGVRLTINRQHLS